MVIGVSIFTDVRKLAAGGMRTCRAATALATRRPDNKLANRGQTWSRNYGISGTNRAIANREPGKKSKTRCAMPGIGSWSQPFRPCKPTRARHPVRTTAKVVHSVREPERQVHSANFDAL